MNAPKHTASTIKSPAFPDLSLEIGYENSNPQHVEDVQVESEGRFQLTQNFEENAARGYSFHLNVAMKNKGQTPIKIPLRILWGEKDYDYCRDYMYVGYDSGKTWRMISTASHNGVTELEVVVPRGRHLLCCTPKFDNNDYTKFLEEMEKRSEFDRMDVAVTPEGRNISCLRCGSKSGRRFVITTRAHPYETAGGYCLLAWLRRLCESASEYQRLFREMELFVFPMINPDGVAAGNGNLSTSGVNFGKELATAGGRDIGAKALVEFVLDLKPVFYLDMHNNTGPHLVDSLRTNSETIVERFGAVAPDFSHQQKTWVVFKKDIGGGYLFAECHKRFGTRRILTEFPWYTRLPDEMKTFGCAFFDALLPVLMDME